jgi:hypothetical protein
MTVLYIFIFQTFLHHRLEGKTFSLLLSPLKGHLLLAPSNCDMHTAFKNGLSGGKEMWMLIR